MGYTRVSHLALAALIGALLGAVLLTATGTLGLLPPLQPRGMVAVPLLITALVLAQGVRVRRLRAGRPTTLTHIGAARVAMLAKAATLGGAALLGTYGALALGNALAPPAPLPREQAVVCALTAAGFLLLTAVALLVERWCRIDPPDDDADAGPGGSDPTPA